MNLSRGCSMGAVQTWARGSLAQSCLFLATHRQVRCIGLHLPWSAREAVETMDGRRPGAFLRWHSSSHPACPTPPSGITHPAPWPGAPRTTFTGSPILCGTLIQGLLLPVVVFIGFAVTARAGTDATLERPAAQHLSTVGWTQHNYELRGPLLTMATPCRPHRTGLGVECPQRTASPLCVHDMPPRVLAQVPCPTSTILSPQTHSRVSRVMITRMGLRFMPPTQLLLHMKL